MVRSCRIGNRCCVAVVQRIEEIDSAHIAAANMVIVPAHPLVFIRPCLLLNRVIEDQHAVAAFDRANHWFDLLPQVLGGKVLSGQEPRNPVMAHLAFHHGGQPRCRRRSKCAQQIVRVQVQISPLHAGRVSGQFGPRL